MSKSDFWAIANAVADTKRWLGDDDEAGHAALASVTRQLAGACARQYTGAYGFNRPKFLEACGYPQD